MKGKQWERALQLLQQMFRQILAVDVVICSAVISACANSALQWQMAIGMLQQVLMRTLQPNVVSCSAAISACEMGA